MIEDARSEKGTEAENRDSEFIHTCSCPIVRRRAMIAQVVKTKPVEIVVRAVGRKRATMEAFLLALGAGERGEV